MNYESTIPSEDIAITDDIDGRTTNRRLMVIVAAVIVALLLAYMGYNYFMGGAADEEAPSQAPMVTVMAPGSNRLRGPSMPRERWRRDARFRSAWSVKAAG